MSCHAVRNLAARAWRGVAAPLGAFAGLAVIAFAAPSNAQAQATVRGTVTDATGQPVPGVEVRVAHARGASRR
jgi:hypothetical protein